ncbi:hypothetical protein FACS1894110_01010 [Spirochaetia bacterium]|nr:hypothetical protein FACS1894110_01010 [Spirochaetia bacterium]
MNQYISEIDKIYRSGNGTEHSYRSALKTLFENITKGLVITNEPKRIVCGAPDYIITRDDIPVGYIEAKDITVGLNSKLNREQFDRYKQSLGNLIITDYLTFQLFRDGELAASVSIAKENGGGISPDKTQFTAFTELVEQFVGYRGKSIYQSEQLAKMMAAKAKLLAHSIEKALAEKTSEDDTLSGQLEGFRKVLIHDLSETDFADIYAQTLAYGMFAARLNDRSDTVFNRVQAAHLIPLSNPFLRKFFQYIAGFDLDDRIRWIVDALADLFNCVAVDELLKEFARTNQDPYIHFYETFLAEYDPKLRESRGVYYTPLPVVQFIVRAVDDILQKEFKLPQGLADNSKIKRKVTRSDGTTKSIELHKVQILDPATGTGTFLAEVINKIYEGFAKQQGMWTNYCAEHLIPRLNGFEILMASYAMAHFKLDMTLKETGYHGEDNSRLRVYLTNSLEEPPKEILELPFAQWLGDEAAEANKIKRDTPVMVVLGNPPYSVSSQNKGGWIQHLLEDYKKDLNEQNIQPLSDDYIKFIRYGQYLIDRNSTGVLAYISNSSFTDGLIHRRMRKALLETFDRIYILDLHGSSKKKETAPDGGKDENVFDIQQGVSINLFIKTGQKKKDEPAKVLHFDLYGKREEKYRFLQENSLSTVKWKELLPQELQYFFVTKDFGNQEEYDKGFKVQDLFPVNSDGIVTARDDFTIHDTEQTVKDTINEFLTLDDESARIRFNLGKDVRDWSVAGARKDLTQKPDFSKIIKINYRPFDIRYTYYTEHSSGFHCTPRGNVMRHFLPSDNVGLILGRQGQVVGSMLWNLIFITSRISDKNIYYRGGCIVCPLYRYPEKDALDHDENRRPNLDMKIVNEIAAKIALRFTAEKEPPLTEKLKQAQNLVLDPNAYLGKYEIDGRPKENAASITAYLKQMAKTVTLENADVRGPIVLSANGISKITSFGMTNAVYMKIIAHIPAMLKNAILVYTQKPDKPHSHYRTYKHLVVGIKIDGEYYTIRIVLGESNGLWYYTNIVSKIEKGTLLEACQESNLGRQKNSFPYINDTKLPSILQGIFAKNPDFFSPQPSFSPIDLLDYIYAVLHSPAYRERYREFLKIDFPRVPYPSDAASFRALAGLGAKLRNIHLLEGLKSSDTLATYPIEGTNQIDKLNYLDEKVWINKTQYFDDVPPEVWEFYIGGYQPAQKWLKDRKERVLNYDDIQHYQKIVVALQGTIEVQREIDIAGAGNL